ncbi:MAG TPA: pepsin/retropepsin-like aspartic protease family protein [Rhizomicrobium sp.]|nr:pepsin/retropepsin-like aspartic protease family protein [Rhizomicrobium sp.]
MTGLEGKAKPFAAVLIAAVLGLTASARADDTCRLQRALKLDMTTLMDGRVSVPMTIGGQTVHMLIDTGGLFSMLTPQTVTRLDLAPQIIPLSRITQYGGLVVKRYVVARDVSLGGIEGYKFDFLVMPEHGYPPDIGGLLAPDIMRNYDADFDFANATFSLFLRTHCEGEVVYWTRDPYGVVDINLNDRAQINVPVMLDGQEIRATIDTGAYHSVASLETIEDKFGIDEKNPNLRILPGSRPEHPRYHYPFKTLSLQSVTVNNPDLILIPDNQSRLPPGAPKLLLGINVLRQLHLYVAYGERKLYVTPAAAH